MGLTRDQAIDELHKGMYPNSSRKSVQQWMEDRDWARRAVDTYVALGMLDLAPPPPESLTVKETLQRRAADLRRNPGGSDDYPWEKARYAAAELDRLVAQLEKAGRL